MRSGLIAVLFQFCMFMMFALTLEVSFSAIALDHVLGFTVPRRAPKKFLEGFVSLSTAPLTAFIILIFFVPTAELTSSLPWLIRFFLWAVCFTAVHWLYSYSCHRVFGIFRSQFYSESRYKIGKNGYSFYTLIPVFGIAGLLLESYAELTQALTPFAVLFFLH